MSTIKVSIDAKAVRAQLTSLQQRQMPFALALTVTRLAGRVQNGLIDEMGRRFDRPTTYTLSSTYKTMATKASPTAEVGMKAEPNGKARLGMADVLGHQFSGGARRHKALEGWLAKAGYLSAGEYVAPGSRATLDASGNMSRGQVQQILSQLGAGPDAAQSKTTSSRSKKNVKRAGVLFWSRGGRLPRGVWMRDGRNVRPILMVVSAPSYTQRIDLPALAQGIVDKHKDREYVDALVYALKTAR